MGYSTSLDEVSLEKLTEEISRRLRRQRDGRCDYCARPSSDPSCKFPGRHGQIVPWDRIEITAGRVVDHVGGAARHTITDPHDYPDAQR